MTINRNDSANGHRERREAGLRDARLLWDAENRAARIDWSAILAVVLIGELFGDRIPFSGNALPHDPRKTSDAYSHAGERPSFQDEAPVAVDTAHPAGVYKQYDEILRRTIETVPKDQATVMGLSGGRDSRHIALAIRASGRDMPRLVTSRHFLGNSSETDVAVARHLASRFDSEIQIVDQPGDRIRLEWDKNRETGMQTLSHSWGLALAEALNGPEVLYDGMNGGVLFGRSGLMRSFIQQLGTDRPSLDAMRKHVISTLIDQPANAIQAWMPSELMPPERLQDIRERLDACFSQYENHPNPIQAFQYGEHVRRNTRLFTYGMMRNERIVCPLDTPEMVEFALSLPWSISCDPHFQDKTIAYLYPDVVDIPYAEALGKLPVAWTPDPLSEAESWKSVRRILAPHVSEAGLALLDQTRQRQNVIQRCTLLAQAFYWDEHGRLPEAEAFFMS